MVENGSGRTVAQAKVTNGCGSTTAARGGKQCKSAASRETRLHKSPPHRATPPSPFLSQHHFDLSLPPGVAASYTSWPATGILLDLALMQAEPNYDWQKAETGVCSLIIRVSLFLIFTALPCLWTSHGSWRLDDEHHTNKHSSPEVFGSLNDNCIPSFTFV